tara:strand:- start:514 stop:1635 length:1122 start_codon:yes stop_codon:yes gene_type:complete
MILSESDASRFADSFIDYFSNTGRIDEYLLKVKSDRIAKMPSALPGFGPEDDLFGDFDRHPSDMKIKVVSVKGKALSEQYSGRLQITMSHVFEDSIPGKSLKWMVYEENTDTIIGFIRFGSPTINSKPRNDWLGTVPDLGRFNRHAIMGFVIVPTQPFGFNYLGGKLLAMLCCSHEAREELNKKYDANICLFETTSLYGSTKSSSQYDGLKPYMRYKGLTDSDFTPLLHDSVFQKLNKEFTALNNNKCIVKEDASSRKLKIQSKMISLIKNSLGDVEKLKQFNDAILSAKNLTQQKRFYMSTYGFKNSREVILGEQETLVKAENYDRFSIDQIVSWWRKKASRRYESLREDGRLRMEREIFEKDTDPTFDIIR